MQNILTGDQENETALTAWGVAGCKVENYSFWESILYRCRHWRQFLLDIRWVTEHYIYYAVNKYSWEGSKSAVLRTCDIENICWLCPPSILFFLLSVHHPRLSGQSTLALFLAYIVRGDDPAASVRVMWHKLDQSGSQEPVYGGAPSIFAETIAKKFFIFVGLLSWSW